MRKWVEVRRVLESENVFTYKLSAIGSLLELHYTRKQMLYNAVYTHFLGKIDTNACIEQLKEL